MENIKTMLAKTLFPRKSVSLLIDLLSTTCSLVSSFSIFVGLERRIRLLLTAYSNPNDCNLELFSTSKKMKHIVLFTTQDIFFMNYYLKIAHIFFNRTAMNAPKTK